MFAYRCRFQKNGRFPNPFIPSTLILINGFLCMLHYKLLCNLMILSLAIAVVFPGYEYLFVSPAYNELLTEETESEAVRYARYMVRTLDLENQFLTKERLPAGLIKSLQPASSDDRLIKLRIFSAHGEIIFSTKTEEIGTLNEKVYFREIVAKGQVYSKVVQKDRKTADGDVTQIDIVETYVPFMAGDAFGGAIEVYYDVTESVRKISALSFHSMSILLVMSLGFLLAISIALYRAYISLLERDKAEEALRLVNEELEQRVVERTMELSQANEQLANHIAERTQAQVVLGQVLEEIRVDRGKLHGILHSVPDGVVVTDGELNVLHMNAAAESILETPLEKVLGQPIGELSHDVDFLKEVGQCLNVTHGPRSFDFEVPNENNTASRIYQVRISRFVQDEIEAAGVVLLVRDVTREREIESMKSAFLAMAAHELNTPLTTIIGYTELLTAKGTAKNFDMEQQKDFLLLIHNKALALGGLIDDLLDISRIESGRPLALNCQEFQLDTMMREVVAAYCEKDSTHLFEMVLPDEAALVCADRTRLEQAVDHLISNAVKYSPEGSSVRIVLASHIDNYQISVADEGIGMNEEQLAHIFDRFYRADSSDTSVQGIGLGMSIVRNIVLAHHGDIQVDSQVGGGTSVFVTLPMTPPPGCPESHQPFAS